MQVLNLCNNEDFFSIPLSVSLTATKKSCRGLGSQAITTDDVKAKKATKEYNFHFFDSSEACYL